MKGGFSVNFREIPDHPNYVIDDRGNVINRKTNYILKNILHMGKGNPKVEIDGTMYYVSRLVAEAFVPNPFGFPCVIHKDGNSMNNCAYNLQWAEYSDISLKNSHFGRSLGRKTGKNKKIGIVETGAQFESIKDCAAYLGVKPDTITNYFCGRQNTVKGYHLFDISE